MPEGVPFTHGNTTSAPTTLAPVTTQSPSSTPKPPSNVVVIPAPVGTTLAPTTLAPTTLEPTTLAPTTLEPTTFAPTTLEPTTTLQLATTPQPTTTSAPIPELWTPKDLNLSAWYDAKDSCSVVVDQNSKVSKWRDKSGENNHATQSVPSRRLTYLESDPLADDKSSLQSLSNLGRIGLEIPSFSMKEVFMVLYYDDSTDEDFDQYNIILSSTGTYGKYRIMGVKNEDDLSDSVSWSFNSQTFKNGSSLSSNEVLPLPNSVMRFVSNSVIDEQRFLFSGTYSSASDRGWKGSVCEIIALPDSPTSADVEKIEGYLAHKWGLEADLPSNHNFKTSAPTETILPSDHPYSLTMSNACSAGGIDLVESALDVRMTAPTIGGQNFFDQGGSVLVFSKENANSSEIIEPTSNLPSNLSGINWSDYFPSCSELLINDQTAFYSRLINDFGYIKPQTDHAWLSFKYYFINDDSVVFSGNCEIFTDHPICTTTIAPTTTNDPDNPPPLSVFPSSDILTYGGCMVEMPDSSGGGNPDGEYGNYVTFHFHLGLDLDWSNFASDKWRNDGMPVGQYWQYQFDYGIENHELEISIKQTQDAGSYPNETNIINQTIDLSSATLGTYYIRDQNRGEYPHYFLWGKMYAVQIPIDFDNDLNFFGSMIVRSKLDQSNSLWHNELSITQETRRLNATNASNLSIFCSTTTNEPPTTYAPPTTPQITTTCPPHAYQYETFYDSSGVNIISDQTRGTNCEATYTILSYRYFDEFDHCGEVEFGNGTHIYNVPESDLDAMTQSIQDARSNGWIVCNTTTLEPTTTLDSSAFQVGDTTCWWGMQVTIVSVNGNGTYDINTGGGMSYGIQRSALGTDINGNPTNNC